MIALPRTTRVRLLDLVRLGTVGVRTRPMRTTLAALGIAIGIAALIAVVGIPASNQEALRARLAGLGPNLLTAAPGTDLLSGSRAELPATSVPMIRRIGSVLGASATGRTSATVRRTNYVPKTETGAIAVSAAQLDLLDVLRARMRAGTFLSAFTARFPVVVLGARAAQILGIDPASGPAVIWIHDRWFSVAGVVDSLPLAPEIDNAALVGWPAAERYLDFDGAPSQIYIRAADHAVPQVRALVAPTVNPQRPDEVLVSRPSDALAAQLLVEHAYSALFLGLGAVALLVGGIGVGNTMVISVLERRHEIGLRRALGASRRQIGGQFLAESMLLASVGGGLGLLLGTAVTAGYAAGRGWPTVLPPTALAGGAGAAWVVGVLAGVYPAVRAARLTPTEALSST